MTKVIKKQENIKKYAVEVGAVALGAALFAMSLNMFLLPAQIILGGMTGIATVINMLSGAPVGMMIILLNIPLLIANACFFGKNFLGRTAIGLVSTSIAADIINFFPVTDSDPLLCAILGGAAMGAAVGLLLARGYTTGGTDLIACLVKLRKKNASTGTVIMFCDMVIIIGAAVFTGSYDGIFYSLICTWISGRVLDVMLSGAYRAGQVFIISDKTEELVNQIFEKLNRGVTVINATGGYTGERKSIIMCALPKRELYFLKEIVKECDPAAFTVVADAAEVSGNGFVSKTAGEQPKKARNNYTPDKR